MSCARTMVVLFGNAVYVTFHHLCTLTLSAYGISDMFNRRLKDT
jgi:hypothetical protein